MQKTLRINLLARNQAVKRAHKQKLQEAKEEWDQWLRAKVTNQKKQNEYIREERRNRREDWIAGPLAPNRNAGDRHGRYGALDVQVTSHPTIPKAVRKSPKYAGSEALVNDEEGFRGEGMVGNVAVNDRVVVVNGDPRIVGKIGTVTKVDDEKEEVTLQNVNTADIVVPSSAPVFREKNPLITTAEIPLPMANIRLVACFSDPDTGVDRDFVVRHVFGGPPYIQQAHGKSTPAHTRYVGGTEEAIPWPIEADPEEFHRNEIDTARQAVNRRTFLPSIISSPLLPSTPITAGIAERMSKSIMDELRSATQRGKTRHDNESLLRRKLLEDARAIWWRDRKFLSPRAERAEIDIAARREAVKALASQQQR